MGVWIIKYRNSEADMEFKEAEANGAAGIPPFFDQISTIDFINAEIFATHSDESDLTFYKPFNTRDWQTLDVDRPKSNQGFMRV